MERKSKLMRRSSILNVMRRQSKSMGGVISLEDQAAAIDPSSDMPSKMASLLRIVTGATVNAVHQDLAETSSDAISDCSDHINKEIRIRGDWDQDIRDWAKAGSTHSMNRYLTCSNHKFDELHPNNPTSSSNSRVQEIHSYIQTLTQESQRWRELAQTLKEEYKSKRAFKKECEHENELIENDYQLRADHQDLLRQIPEDSDILKQVLEQETALEHARKVLTLAAKKRRRECDDLATELDVSVKTLKTFSDSVHGTKNGLMDLIKTQNSQVSFPQYVEKWLQETKKPPIDPETTDP
ncbi:uncharacterized protein LOC131885224 [Tigriopus californicus]|uniref:uncharacterized protein LOC131885224 n=1 Tax=Tigriopus californicus TaxID=6832 RepID=UPI0027D9E2DF|nr:uncharacterized protein LOC131885224 [Tigriopus californicus]